VTASSQRFLDREGFIPFSGKNVFVTASSQRFFDREMRLFGKKRSREDAVQNYFFQVFIKIWNKY
jgi:hypothetical protein